MYAIRSYYALKLQVIFWYLPRILNDFNILKHVNGRIYHIGMELMTRIETDILQGFRNTFSAFVDTACRHGIKCVCNDHDT